MRQAMEACASATERALLGQNARSAEASFLPLAPSAEPRLWQKMGATPAEWAEKVALCR